MIKKHGWDRTMEFKNLADAKQLMQCIADRLPRDDRYYQDFSFFSKTSFTTLSEYREELKEFLENFIIEGGAALLAEETIKFYPDLVRLYGWL